MATTKTKARKSARKANGGKAKANGSSAPREGYDSFKEFHGTRYTGMKIGRSHHWRYDAGKWTEKKITPDLWEFRYTVTKRRSGKAPEGSGVPVGTGYHWYILANQTATKVDANSYTTDMVGLKYKLAHKRADKATWSASEQAQRRRLIKLLEETTADLKKQSLETYAPAKRAKKPAKSAKKSGNGATKAARARKKVPRAKERHLAAA